MNTNKIEIDITLRCNLKCFNCDRSCGVAPVNIDMTLDTINGFIEESISLNREWKSIAIIGGEPTLHPRFFDILSIFENYKKNYPGCTIKIFTNGYKNEDILSKIPLWVQIINSYKKSNKNIFRTFNVASIDNPESKNSDFFKGCRLLLMCGMGLSVNGYFPCPAGATVDRIFGLNYGTKTMKELTEGRSKEILNNTCKFCGHFRYTTDFYNVNNYVMDQVTSESWENAIGIYKESLK